MKKYFLSFYVIALFLIFALNSCKSVISGAKNDALSALWAGWVAFTDADPDLKSELSSASRLRPGRAVVTSAFSFLPKSSPSAFRTPAA